MVREPGISWIPGKSISWDPPDCGSGTHHKCLLKINVRGGLRSFREKRGTESTNHGAHEHTQQVNEQTRDRLTRILRAAAAIASTRSYSQLTIGHIIARSPP